MILPGIHVDTGGCTDESRAVTRPRVP
jgi:hypothetical protein